MDDPVSRQLPRVALVTSELPNLGPSGGIGAAVHELALGLCASGLETWLYYATDGDAVAAKDRQAAAMSYAALGIQFRWVDASRWACQPGLAARSYAVHRELTAADAPAFDWVHFPDYHGLGFHFLSAVTQGLVEPRPRTVVQLHGPTRWACEVSDAMFSDETQLIADWMERRSIEWADYLVSPSAYLASWVEARYPDRRANGVRVIRNAFRLNGGTGTVAGDGTTLSELIFFGRHEPRKGLVDFCDAMDRVQDLVAARGGSVTFLGSFGEVHDEFSGLYLLDRASRWEAPIRVLPGLSRSEAMSYLRQACDALVVVASPRENSPYALVEGVAAGRFVLTAAQGGANELLASECRDVFTCPPGGAAFAAAIARLLASTTLSESLAQGPTDVLEEWLAFHSQPRQASVQAAHDARLAAPRVSLVITHYERPAKLLEAICSVLRQDYPNLEVLVVDDGSHSPAARQQLAAMEPFLQREKIRLIRQDNAYLGAARNRGLAETSGEFVLFLDDDDLALPTMVSTLVRAQRATGADCLVAMNRHLPESRRAEYANQPELMDDPVSYLPLAGPLSLSPVMNLLGSASVLLRRSAVESVGGYTEQVGVGHEDHELLFALAAGGADVRVVPEPLFLYEVDRPSMSSVTSSMRNHRRVLDRALRDGHLGQFADLVALASGRQAVAIGRARTRYGYQLRDAMEVEFNLLDGGLDPDAALGKLAEVAAQRGLSRLVRDLAASQAARQRIVAGTAASIDRLIADGHLGRPRPGPPPGDLELSLLAVEVSRGPITAAAIVGFEQSVRTASAAAAASATWVRILPWGRLAGLLPDATRHLARTASDLLRRQLEAARFATADAVLAVAAEAWLADTLLDGGRAGLRALMAADSRQYALGSPDVAHAVRSGHFCDEFGHYLIHGQREGRPGFSLTRAYLSLNDGDASAAERLGGVRAMLVEPAPANQAPAGLGHGV
jgi:glycosyltransferase involved in cell wall biosynthesis